MEREFKVGERYSYNGPYEKGIIEVLKVNGDNIKFKVIKGKFGSLHIFHTNSDFAHGLKKLDFKDTIVIYRKDNEVIALNKATGDKAAAKCSPEDEFDFYVGAKLAFQRLLGETPDENAMPDKEVKEVRRVARPGEYVKIVDATAPAINHDGTPAYKNGDIIQIKQRLPFGIAIFKDGHDINDNPYVLSRFEYVVLENYKPEAQDEKPKKAESPSKPQEMTKELKKFTDAMEAEGYTRDQALAFIAAAVFGKAGK